MEKTRGAGVVDAVEAACRRVMAFPGAPLSGLAAVLIKDGSVAWEGYFGARRFDADGRRELRPVDARTRWRVASISKPTVALGVMRLVERGILDLDGDISDYLGYPLRNPHFPGMAITARMLLGHTSSLRDAEFYFPPLGHALRDLFEPGGRYYDGGRHFAGPDSLADRSPGAFYTYCNLGFGLLGSIIERAAGRRFDLYMQEEVFGPLGIDGSFNVNLLTDEGFSGLSPVYRKCPPDREDGWDAEGPWRPQIDDYGGMRPALPVRLRNMVGERPSLEDYRLGENGSLFSPQGGMRIRALDLALIARLFIGGGEVETARGRVRLLREESVRAMMTPGWERRSDGGNCEEEHSRVYATGIGLQRPTGPGGGSALWGHRGNAYGFLGGMFVDRSERSGYVYMIGGTGADPDLNRDPKSGLSIWEDPLGGALEEALSSI